MPPQRSSTTAPRGRGASTTAAGRPAKSQSSKVASKGRNAGTGASSSSKARASDVLEDPFAEGPSQEMDVDRSRREEQVVEDEDEDEEAPKTIPPELLTRLLHEYFQKDGTRISKDANAAVAKYMDVFVREAIARTAVEKESGFLEVEDLEKVAPQLLLDL
ncbi:CENP-S associating centromere protein X-domain-containing protein [Xylariomycetidae sp. FL0641]|nr:CENP-S associating centromere protein X-domain-containing protein [Xylariomycetidae sp. FL0641]